MQGGRSHDNHPICPYRAKCKREDINNPSQHNTPGIEGPSFRFPDPYNHLTDKALTTYDATTSSEITSPSEEEEEDTYFMNPKPSSSQSNSPPKDSLLFSSPMPHWLQETSFWDQFPLESYTFRGPPPTWDDCKQDNFSNFNASSVGPPS